MASWIPVRGWGGCLLIRELIQFPDGRIGSKWMEEIMPATVPLASRLARVPGRAVLPASHNSFLAVFCVQPAEAKKGKVRISFLPKIGDQAACELQIRLEDQRAQFSPGSLDGWAPPEKSIREGGAPHHAGNFAIENLLGVDRPFTVRVIVKANDKLGGSIIDVEIAGQRTLISYRPELFVSKIVLHGQDIEIRLPHLLFCRLAASLLMRESVHWRAPISAQPTPSFLLFLDDSLRDDKLGIMTMRYLASATGVFMLLAAFATQLSAAPRVLPEGALPKDIRLQPLKDLDGYFPFTPPASKAEWERRAEVVRRQILVSQGLWPIPTRTPLQTVIHGKMDRGDYTVEKVYFESAPGFLVTGNLYRPKNRTGKAPGVLFAHGHWADARLSLSTEAALRQEIADGEERFENGGQSRFQSMCVQLARMGCVVWQWDMLGNSDSQQLSSQLVHGFAKQRPEMNTTENWGLYSPQAETHLQSIMGLQTWNSIRSLDFLLSLPEVDPDRIAMTGASGGGTQTMLLAAIDARVKLAFPAVMVSTAMQGGCTCENASLLRVDTGNIEFAALFAPKPQGMTTANDWTKEMAAKGFPELKQLYTLMGAPDHVMLKRGEHFQHNYNAVSRSAFFTWLNRHFKLGQKEPVIEKDYDPLSRQDLTVWDEQHPAPKAADPDFERQLLRWFHEDAQKQLAIAQATPERFRQTYGKAFEIVLGNRWAETSPVEREILRESDQSAWTEKKGLIRNSSHHEELPVIFLSPKNGNGHYVVWIAAEGKSSLYSPDGSIKPDIAQLLNSGATVVGVDLLYQGEFLESGKSFTKTPRVKNPREAAPYTFGYNYAVFAQRVQDILTVVKYLKKQELSLKRLSLVGLEGAGPWIAAARAQCGTAIDQAVMDTRGFRFGTVLDLHDPGFLPGGAKYGDLPALLALGAPGRAWIAGETEEALELAQSQYQSLHAVDQLKQYTGDTTQGRAAAIEWLLVGQ